MQEAPNAAEFVDAIAPSVARAAEIVSELEGQVANRPKTGEASDVKAALTVADTASQEVILEALLEHFPGVCLRAEEDTPLVHRFPEDAPAMVVLDPIDGTLNCYLNREGPYAIMVGLAVAGEFEAAIVNLPREGVSFHAARGQGAHISGPEESAARRAVPAEDGCRVLVSHAFPEPARDVLIDRGYRLEPACGGAISVAPLVPGFVAGLRFASGEQADISVRGRIGALIAREAGAQVLDETGEAFPEDLGSPRTALIVGARADDLESLRAAVEAVR